jgi:hypothetical protein
MNELLFFLHLLLVFAFGSIALRFGKIVLIAWVSLQAVLANLFVVKQIDFFGLHITCSDVFAIGSILGLNLLQEFFGKESAKQALLSAFFSMLFFAGMSQIHLLYVPSSADTTQAAFRTLLSQTPRLFITSLVVFYLTQQLDIRVFQLLKQKMTLLSFPMRSALSTALSQFTDTLLFSIFGLWGLVASLSDIILVSFLIKLIIISCMTPLLALVKRWIPVKA